MLRQLLFLFSFLFMLTNLYPQKATKDNKTLAKTVLSKTATDSLSIGLNPNQTYSKEKLPSEQKSSPEVFYIINDKPVSREEYLRQNNKKH